MDSLIRIFILSITLLTTTQVAIGSPNDLLVPFVDVTIDENSTYIGHYLIDSPSLPITSSATSASEDASEVLTQTSQPFSDDTFFAPGRIAFWGFLLAGLVAARRQSMS